MSADLNTFIELEGSLEEIKAMLTVIKDYCGQKHNASLDFPRISTKRKFDGENDVLLETLTEDSLDDFLTKYKKKVFVEAGGPYGSYGGEWTKLVCLKQLPKQLLPQSSKHAQPGLLQAREMSSLQN